MIRVLPSFADLMLLPPAIVPGAEVFIKDDRIAVRVSDQPQRHFLVTQLNEYPHVRIRIDGAHDVIIEPKASEFRRLLLVWPEGRTEGVLLWDGGYFSPMDTGPLEAMTAIGLHVQTVFCQSEDTLLTVLLKLIGNAM